MILPTANHISLFLKLSKFRVVLLMMLTALVGISLAPKPTHWGMTQLFSALIGISLIAASGGALNHLAEEKVDQKMKRTQSRPLPQGQLSKNQVIMFASACMLIGSIILALGNNWNTVILTILTMIGYAFIYTLLLKPNTPQNIVIGGLSGALPPLLGWVSVTNNPSAEAWILVLIIFTWTPPHFWALAINRIDDYKKIHYPMLPVTHGIPYTTLSIFLYTILMIMCTQLPYIIAMNGLVYLICANILNILFLMDVTILWYEPSKKRGMRVFIHSIIYLFLLFASMLIDHFLPYEMIIY